MRVPLSEGLATRKQLPETFLLVCPRCKHRDVFARAEVCRDRQTASQFRRLALPNWAMIPYLTNDVGLLAARCAS